MKILMSREQKENLIRWGSLVELIGFLWLTFTFLIIISDSDPASKFEFNLETIFITLILVSIGKILTFVGNYIEEEEK